MTVYKRADSPNWFIEFRCLGQTVRRTSGTPSKVKAKALEERLRREIQDRVAAGKLPTIPFGEAIDRYFETILSPRGKDKVRAKDIYVLDKLRARFGADTPLDTITSAEPPRRRMPRACDRQSRGGLGVSAVARPTLTLPSIIPEH